MTIVAESIIKAYVDKLLLGRVGRRKHKLARLISGITRRKCQ